MLLLNRYEYNPQTDLAGKGESSRVYRGLDTQQAAPVAIKIYRITENSERYHAVHDKQMMLTLEHPSVCSYFDIQEIEKEDSFGEKETLQVCITPFLDKGNLLSWYRNHQDTTRLERAILSILYGLSYLHKKGITHGFIKPGNLLITTAGEEDVAKITDAAMGSYVFGPSPKHTVQPSFSPVTYRSPEQLNTPRYGIEGKIGFNTDLWSLAVVVYEACTGEILFQPLDTDFPETQVQRITSFTVDDRIMALPAPFNALLQKCLVTDATRRAQSAEELIALMENHASQLHRTASTTPAKTAGDAVANSNGPTSTNHFDEALLETLPASTDPKSKAPSPLEDEDMTRLIDHTTLPVGSAKSTEEDDDDVTRMIDKPTSSQPTDSEQPDDDSTQVIDKTSIHATQDDDVTQLLVHSPESVTNTNDGTSAGGNIQGADVKEEDEDATKLISSPGQFSAGAGADSGEDDVTRVLKNEASSTGTLPAEEVADQTMILSSLRKESVVPSKTTPGLQQQQGDGNNPTEIVIKKRGKPVVLFNRYEYFPNNDLIGKGGFSRVYKAYDKKLSRWVALKIYKTGEFSDRYSPIAEIKRVVNLDHPNICRYLDIEEIENENPFGENEKIQVCVMELLDSGNFGDYYKSNKDPATLKKLLQDILNGIAYLHKNGIIHRDIKPGNILIKQTIEGPVAKITDFGISKKSDADNNNSSSALIVSIPYMAPEQLNAKKYGINENISYNLDLWSLGVTVYEVITGKVLFKNSPQDNSEQIMANIMAPELPEKINDLPEPFRTIVAHCVVKNARERASRAEELMVLLHNTSAASNTTAILASEAANAVASAEKEGLLSNPGRVEDPPAQITVPAEEKKLPEKKAARDIPVAIHKKGQSRIALADTDEKIVSPPTDNKNRNLLIFIGIAVLLFVIYIVYLKAFNSPAGLVQSKSAPPPRDTVTKASVPTVLPDSSKKDTAATVADTIADMPASTVHKTVHPVVKSKAENVAKHHATEATTGSTAAKYTLSLSAESNCTVKVNAMPYGKIRPGAPMNIFLPVGKYTLQFINADNAVFYTANIEVKPENIGRADRFRVPSK